MKKLLLLLFPLLLTSCGSSKVYGHYVFQMGSDKGSHLGVFTDLTEEDYYMHEEGQEAKLMGKKFKFGMNLSADIMPSEPKEEDYLDDPAAYLEQLFMYTFMLLLNVEQNPDAGLVGYYNKSDKFIEGKGNRLEMAIVLADTIPLPHDLLENFIVSYIAGNNVKIILPVSVPDIQYQLCWYGLYIEYVKTDEGEEFNPIALPTPLPGPQGEDRFGSHPSADEVQQMNEKYKDIFAKSKFTFKDFHTLTIDLTKK